MSGGPITIEVSGRTDVGMEREHNEDNFLVGDLSTRTRAFADGAMRVGPNGILLAVCDGMGGAAAGEIASELAVTVVHQEMVGKNGIATSRDDLAARLERATQLATSRIHADAVSNPAWQGMGTTLTAAALVDDHLVLAQVGDSRAYVLRNGRLAQVTRDQSLVAKLVEMGVLSDEQAAVFEHSNIILQALGAAAEVIVEISQLVLRRGDRVLLCSDGLSGMVTNEEIEIILSAPEDPSTICLQLIERAKECGGYDNITAIVAFFEGEGLLDGDGPVSAERYGGGELSGIPDPRGLGEHMRPRIQNGMLVDLPPDDQEPVDLEPPPEEPTPALPPVAPVMPILAVVEPPEVQRFTEPLPIHVPTPPPPSPLLTPAPVQVPVAHPPQPQFIRAPSALRATMTSITFPLPPSALQPPPAPRPSQQPPPHAYLPRIDSPVYSSGSADYPRSEGGIPYVGPSPDSAPEIQVHPMFESGSLGAAVDPRLYQSGGHPPARSSSRGGWIAAIVLLAAAIIFAAVIFLSADLRRGSAPAASAAPTSSEASSWTAVEAPSAAAAAPAAAAPAKPMVVATPTSKPVTARVDARAPARPAVAAAPAASTKHDLAPQREDE